ncbi:MAG TPA: glycosyltransferase family A protein [Stellaceae bacterium]|jgi:glycosyltransferase involved in cell wall biosynthesis|nr:glycosyltransferase family A protein [Stellaceae bacterium]
MGPADGMPADTLVSIIIPVYNRAHLVGRAIASVMAQSYQNFEIIVVDDASTDALPAALAAFPDPRLRLIAHETNQGAAGARNTGMAAANGEFIAFLDSDDMWFAGKLAHQVTAMRGQPAEIAGHVCAYECVKTGYPARHILPRWTARTFRRRLWFGCSCGPGTTLLFRRALFTEIGPLDRELRRLEDWDWLLRLAAAGYRLLASPAVLARVYAEANAARRDVDPALARIQQRHLASAALDGVLSRRIFEGTLLLESAAAAFADKDYRHAATATLRSVVRYPLRGAGFYWRMIERAAGSAGRLMSRSQPQSSARLGTAFKPH